jgi:hypothetical protein
MNRMIRSAAAVLPLFAIAACSGAAPDDGAASASEKLTKTQNFVYTNQNISELLTIGLQIQNSQLSVQNGNMVFIPSSAMSDKIWPGDDPSAHVITAPIPSKDIDLPFCGTSTATVTGLNPDMRSVTAEVSNSVLSVHVPFSGSVHMSPHSVCPDFDILINAATIDIHLGHSTVSTVDDLLSRGTVVHVTSTSAECGFASICSSIVAAVAASDVNLLESGLASAVESNLLSALASPKTTAGVDFVLGGLATQIANTQSGQPSWVAVPGSLAIGADNFTWTATQFNAPTVPGDCSLHQDSCTLAVLASCTSATDPLVLERLDTKTMPLLNGGVVTFQVWDNVGAPTSNVFQLIDGNPPLGTTVTYHVCAVNSLGRACGPDTQIVTTSQRACVNPGSGGTTGGGAPGPKPGHAT